MKGWNRFLHLASSLCSAASVRVESLYPRAFFEKKKRASMEGWTPVEHPISDSDAYPEAEWEKEWMAAQAIEGTNPAAALDHYHNALRFAGDKRTPALEAWLTRGVGDCYRQLGKWAEALHAYERARALKPPSDDAERGRDERCLAEVMAGLDRAQEARERFRSALELLPADRPEHSRALRAQALTEARAGRWTEALALYQRAERTLLEHKHTALDVYAQVLGEGAEAALRAEQFSAAAAFFRRLVSLAGERNVAKMGPLHAHYGGALYDLGRFYFEVHCFDLAVPPLAEALPIFEATMGAQHERTTELRVGLEQARARAAQPDKFRSSHFARCRHCGDIRRLAAFGVSVDGVHYCNVECQNAAPKPVCACCGKPAAPLRCSQCKAAWYCEVACQRRHWPQHKDGCDLKKNN